MDRDSFITAVFLTVCEQYNFIKQSCKIRRGGFAPALSDEEVIAMEICGEYFKLECDKDIFACFHAHCRRFFPKLHDRSLFVRQAANLWQVKAAVQKRLTRISGEINGHVQSIDTFPLPVCVLARGRRDRCFPGEADFGCLRRQRHALLRIQIRSAHLAAWNDCTLPPARPHDVQSTDILPEEFEGAAPADKGFIDERRQSLLLERHGILAVTPPRKNMKTAPPESLLQFCRRIRKRIETVGPHLTERFKTDHIRVHDLWHFQHRLIRKILAHAICVFINLTCNHPPLHLDGLIAA